ncbi:MAG: hypothetical protein RI907_1471 [Pseudomonadota bacterium]|jgi:hypothetical protein
MRWHKAGRQFAAPFIVAAVLSACGGGGGSAPPTVNSGNPSATPPGTTPGTTWGVSAQGELPGALLVRDPGDPVWGLSLRDGSVFTLPPSDQSGKNVYWAVASGGQRLVQWSDEDWLSRTPIRIYDAHYRYIRSLTLACKLTTGSHPLLSPDGRYILSSCEDNNYDEHLNVFDAQTGGIVKQGSMLDDAVVIAAAPADWLPDGHYLYMVGNQVVVASPTEHDDTVVGDFPTLPYNSVWGDQGEYVAGHSSLVVSPDGQRIAFTWTERHGLSWDTHVWVAAADGSEPHRVTHRPLDEEDSILDFGFGSPQWSPDGRWLSLSMYMNGVSVGPVDPLNPEFGSRVIGTTGCGVSPVYIVPANSEQVPLTWLHVEPTHGLAVAPTGTQPARWLSTCGSAMWAPFGPP